MRNKGNRPAGPGRESRRFQPTIGLNPLPGSPIWPYVSAQITPEAG
jgi:hypothetical protein